MAVQDREKTAFSTPYRLYQFTRMPFGLQGALATFQRMIDKLLDGMGEFASAYLDDVVIYSTTWQEHLQHLRAVLDAIQQAGLTLKRKKCQFAMPECVYLGHSVGSGRVRPEDVKLEAVHNFEQPTTKTQVRTFLGLTGYILPLVYSPVLSSRCSPDRPNSKEPAQPCGVVSSMRSSI